MISSERILQGLSLAERVVLQPVCRTLNPPSERAGERFRRWKSWFLSDKEWRSFLQQAGQTEEGLLALAESRVTEVAPSPSWVTVATELLTYLAVHRSVAKPALSVASNLARPVADFAARKMWRDLAGARADILSTTSRQRCKRALILRLGSSATQILDWETHQWSGGKLPEMSVMTRREVIPTLFPCGPESATQRLLEAYPALLRLWSRQVEAWWSFLGEFLRNAEEFATTQCYRVSGGKPIGLDLVPALSDYHNGNRTVLAVEFAHGKRWHYKPRSGAQEAAWFRLLEWLNNAGFPKPFRLVEVVRREDHCWMESISAKEVRTARAGASYYFRAGALLYLAHSLRAVDLHAGNWIACGAQPVLIDSETLLHTATRIPAEFRKNETDLLRTGMLPKGSSRDPSREVSAFGRLVPGSHLLRMRRKPVPACDFAPSIINGFLAMHDLFRKRGLSVESLTGLLGLTSTRRIYRPTSLYTLFERRSHSPAIMRSGLERSLILQAACHDGAVSRPRAGQEALALEQGDIPIFHGAPAAPRPLRTAREIRRSLDLLKQALRSSAY